MDDASILARITSLVEREHELRGRRADGGLEADHELDELRAAEVELDQCWDLLRQRRAKSEFGADSTQTEARPPSVVENYLQ
ncbi:DUF2630 family protein [Nocardioides sp.]|uniref:DUF2630 family protein n=1 Tax=Nocardioides sp. TaxID=35761 RepID=UPI003D09C831